MFRAMSLNGLVENTVESPELKVSVEGQSDGHRMEMKHIDAIYGQLLALIRKSCKPPHSIRPDAHHNGPSKPFMLCFHCRNCLAYFTELFSMLTSALVSEFTTIRNTHLFQMITLPFCISRWPYRYECNVVQSNQL
jgi:hypothetical protein